MKVPFFSLSEQIASLKGDALKAIEGVIDSGGFANGPATKKFESELAEFLGCKHVVAVNTGTTALHAALICAGVKEGDEVATVSHTWISTVWSVSYMNAKPVFVDIDEGAGMDPAALEAAITPKTKAILPVHLYGNPLNIKELKKVADKHGIPLIEDAAQSVGATHGGKQTGTFGAMGITSFYPSKNLGAFGEGGAVFTDDDELAARARRLRDHAQASRHHHTELGFNWRMDGFQGAVLSVKLPHLNGWNQRRRALGAIYNEGLAGIEGLDLLKEREGGKCIWHVYPVFHKNRDAMRGALEKRGIGTSVHYPTPVHLQPVYEGLGYDKGSLPNSERMAGTELSLPMFPEMTDEQAQLVVTAVKEAVEEVG